MVSAIKASVLAGGSLNKSRTDKARVMLWAIVKAVIVLIKFIKPLTRKIRPNTKSM